jgi:leucyl aminopeptidase
MSVLCSYSFQDYKSIKEKQRIYFLCNKEEKSTLSKRLETLKCIYRARDLGYMPSNELTPEKFVKIVKAFKWKNTKIKVLGPKDIEKKKL